MSKIVAVVPTCYRAPEISSWGWHKASELLECANNLRALQGSSPFSTKEFGETFAYLHKLKTWGEKDDVTARVYDVLHKNGVREEVVVSWDSDFGKHIEEEAFVPAKWGMNVLWTIRHPRLAIVKKTIRS